MKQDLSDKREIYAKNKINFGQIPENPITLFNDWYQRANENPAIKEANAMHFTSIETDGFPRARVVLLKEFDQDGFVFYTNYNSQKGKAINENNHVGLSFFWHDQEQQIIIKGLIDKVDQSTSDEYFQKRPFESQIGAIVSNQSSVIAIDTDLDQIAKELENQYKNKTVDRPENWGGYKVIPTEIEFWQGRPSRLHDRLRYRLVDQNWTIERLSP